MPPILRRLAAAIDAGRRAAAPTRIPPSGSNPAASPIQTSWALISFGEPAALAHHRAFCKARGFRCLVLSDDIPGICVGSREMVFEYLPWPARTALTTPGGFGAATDHTFRRLSQILAFWDVVGCDWAGAQADELFDLVPEWAHPVVRASRSAKGNRSQFREHVLI